MASNVCFLCFVLVYSTGFLPRNVLGQVSGDLENPPLLDYGPLLDEEEQDDLKITINLKENISYFGGVYDTVYISKDGLIAFEPDVEYQKDITWREGVRNARADKPFMAPFLHNGFNPNSLVAGTYQGRIYHRTIYKSDLVSGDDDDEDSLKLLTELDEYIKGAVVDPVSQFEASMLLVVTWADVTDVASSEDNCDRTFENPCKSATFQAVIVANKTESFAIFNYKRMDIPIQDSYQSGFNGGYGRGWFNVIPCHGQCALKLDASRVNQLPQLAGSELKGRYVLKVGQERIVRGGCLPSSLPAGMLEVFPTTVGMFGGEMLRVSGKCLRANSKIYCKFGAYDDSPITEGRMDNSMKGHCPVPILTTREPILVQWSEDGKNWASERTISVALPDRLGRNDEVDMSYREKWYSNNAQTITVQWTPPDLSLNSRAEVEVNLIGYREDDASGKVEFKKLKKLGSKVNNREGKLSVDVSTYRCKSDCEKYEMGLLEVSLTSDYYSAATYRYAVRYGPIPLGWYVNEKLTSSMGSDWVHQKCQAWYDEDKKNTDWMKDLPACPCNLNQAVADFGRWQPGKSCNMFTRTKCRFHSTAKHCVRSIHANSKGAGNQCCYDSDGNLLYSQLSYKGSTPDRSHAWGASPFRKANFVPGLSHWRHDVVPFYYCCVWNDEKCDLYTKLRPTPSCENYDAPGIGLISGDPHITTFDGQMYNFGGKGDFWLVRKGNEFKLQGRFTDSPGVWDLGRKAGQQPFKPTALTYLVLQGNGVILEFHAAPENSMIPRGLDIRVSNDRAFFLTKSTMWQDFKGYSIFNNDMREKENPHDNFTILVEDNIGVNVAAVNGLLYVTVSLPPTMKGKTGQRIGMGLMGFFDGINDNDFVDVNNKVSPLGRPKNELYQNFAMSWGISRKNSLFPFHMVADAKYTPIFEYNQIPTGFDGAPTESQISELCKDSGNCKWDYKITGNKDIALATKAADERIDYQRDSAKVETICGLPNVGRNAILTSNNFTRNSKLAVTGCGAQADFHGELSLKCITESLETARANGREQYGIKHMAKDSTQYITHWVPEPTPVCTEKSSDSDETDTAMIIGICVGVGVVLIVIAIVAIIFICKKRSGKSERQDSPTTRSRRNEDPQRDPAAAENMLSGTNRNPVYKPSDQSVRIGSSV